MVKVSVFLVRHGESETDVSGGSKETLPNMSQLYEPTKGLLQELTRKIDPSLTERGFQQAEEAFRAMAETFRWNNQTRRIAYYSSPFQRCMSSALMISTSGFEPQEWSKWGLTSVETHHAPTAIPIVVENGLLDLNAAVRDVGGYQVALEAGLLPCAALFWNKGYKKDPIMGIVQQMKDKVQERVKKWVDGNNDADATVVSEDSPAEEAAGYRLAADVQYLRMEQDNDPYSLVPMSLKFNIVNDLLAPNKIMEPHRNGVYNSKLPPTPASVALQRLDHAVYLARTAGCDTIILVVTPELISAVAQQSGDAGTELVGPGDVTSFVVDVGDGPDDALSWTLHSVAECGTFDETSMPPFTGSIERTIHPSEEFEAAMKAEGGEKWGAFPPPLPEVIKPNYPKDIPPFGQALDLDDPATKKWAWVHLPET
jgi:Histidine phosphatase superfamily (branch 1)